PGFEGRAGERVKAGEVVVELAELSTLVVEANVPEAFGSRLAVGAAISVKPLGASPRTTRVSAIGASVEESGGERSVRVQAVLDNSDGALKKDSSGEVEFDAGRASLLERAIAAARAR